jgi:hypothetical protein
MRVLEGGGNRAIIGHFGKAIPALRGEAETPVVADVWSGDPDPNRGHPLRPYRARMPGGPVRWAGHRRVQEELLFRLGRETGLHRQQNISPPVPA